MSDREFLEKIAEETDSNGGFTYYDTWGSDERAEKYKRLKEEFIDKDIIRIIVEGKEYYLKFKKAQNPFATMGGSPDMIEVRTG